jgi:hypothetical protein
VANKKQKSAAMDTKRIRFGFLCSSGTSVTSEMLVSIGLRSMECALSGDKQYVIITVSKSMKGNDVMAALVDAGHCWAVSGEV